MAKVSVYNAQGKQDGQRELNDSIFAVPAKPDLIHQVYVALEANARQPWAHAKDKSEIRGGGKKPWKQKGTGRARHGSSRSPIWTGGGVTFGPLNTRNFGKKVNKKMNRSAVMMCLSDKVNSESMVALKGFESSGKTKEFATLRSVLPMNGKSTLLLVDGNDESLARASKNVPRVNMQQAKDVNVADLLHHQFVIATEGAIEALEKRFS